MKNSENEFICGRTGYFLKNDLVLVYYDTETFSEDSKFSVLISDVEINAKKLRNSDDRGYAILKTDVQISTDCFSVSDANDYPTAPLYYIRYVADSDAADMEQGFRNAELTATPVVYKEAYTDGTIEKVSFTASFSPEGNDGYFACEDNGSFTVIGAYILSEKGGIIESLNGAEILTLIDVLRLNGDEATDDSTTATQPTTEQIHIPPTTLNPIIPLATAIAGAVLIIVIAAVTVTVINKKNNRK